VDRDLALDSLARTELLRRIEDKFQVQLDEQHSAGRNATHDLVNLILHASGGPKSAVNLASRLARRRRWIRIDDRSLRIAPRP
jgi:hypothetical protein